MNANWTWKAQGDANEYVVLDGGKWVAAIRLNGEMTVARQEQVMNGIASVHDLVAVAQYVVDRAQFQGWDEKDALLVMATDAIAEATGVNYVPVEKPAAAHGADDAHAFKTLLQSLHDEDDRAGRNLWDMCSIRERAHMRKVWRAAQQQADARPMAYDATTLDRAITIVCEARDSIGAGGYAVQASMERAMVEPYLDGIEDELRALYDTRPETAALDADVTAACTLLEAKEYAEHWAATELGKRLEAALTELHDDAAIQRDALRAVAEAVAEETTSWVANQHTLGVPNDAPDLDAIIDRTLADHPQAEPRILASARDLHAYCAERAKLLADGQPKEIEALLRGELLGVGLKCIKWLEARQAGGAA